MSIIVCLIDYFIWLEVMMITCITSSKSTNLALFVGFICISFVKEPLPKLSDHKQQLYYNIVLQSAHHAICVIYACTCSCFLALNRSERLLFYVVNITHTDSVIANTRDPSRRAIFVRDTDAFWVLRLCA